ncbi:hypothetical protein CC78DRAFT_591377 [Lojkania enalia]|uniref:Uncharacterized protein n=1 Tax=Lojkania enalia TaxID=147567 RepID=A0A9P4K082_9PLEO|nr:hypothetical protein CC78DRAFT_591377 [Didymosphaeria enalia]
MHRPLVDIDPNPRQRGPKPAKLQSFKTNPSTPVNARTVTSRKRATVSSKGSPRYAAHTVSSSQGKMSSKTTSKIPLRAPTPSSLSRSVVADKVAAHRLSQPVAQRDGLKSPRSTLLPLSPPVSSPRSVASANLNKPLPSPPVAQVVKSMSPAKAARTLVDADVLGTPLPEDWPALQPDTNPSAGSILLSAKNPYAKYVNKDNDNSSFAWHIRSNGHGEQECSATGGHGGYWGTDNLEASKGEQNSSVILDQEPRDPQAVAVGTADMTTHAISTLHGEALDSPLAYKYVSNAHETRLVDNPQSSSNKSSIPVPARGSSIQGTQKTLIRAPSVRPGSTKWPLLNSNIPADSKLSGVGGSEPKSSNEEQSIHTFHTSLTEQNSKGSMSLSEMTTAIHPKLEQEEGLDSGNRVKRLSNHSINSGLGPILKIAEEADSVIFGKSSPMSETPPFPNSTSRRLSQERSFSALAGRISRQSMSVSVGKRSRSVTPQSFHAGITGYPRVNPIRSMQPSRKGSTEFDSKSSSATTIASRGSASVLRKQKNGELSQLKEVSEMKSPVLASPNSENFPDMSIYRNKGILSIPPDSIPAIRLENGVGLASTKTIDLRRCSAMLDSDNSSVGGSFRGPDRSSTSHGSSVDATLYQLSDRGSRCGQSDTIGPQFTAPTTVVGPQHSDSHRGHPKVSVTVTSMTEDKARTLRQRPYSAVIQKRSVRRSSSQIVPTEPKVDNGKDNKDEPAKVRLKRSFRNIFHKRNDKANTDTSQSSETKRLSVTMAGSSFVKRLRSSANLSKPTLSKDTGFALPPASRPASATALGPNLQNMKVTDRDVYSSPPDFSFATRPDTPGIIRDLIGQVKDLPEGSEDRLRGLQIAQVCHALYHHTSAMKELVLTQKVKQAVVHAVEMGQQARLSAHKAKKHARDAQICSEAAKLAVQNLLNMCETGFSVETRECIMDLCRRVGSSVAVEQHFSATASPAPNKP